MRTEQIKELYGHLCVAETNLTDTQTIISGILGIAELMTESAGSFEQTKERAAAAIEQLAHRAHEMTDNLEGSLNSVRAELREQEAQPLGRMTGEAS